jgi:hypothetical protein
MPTALLTTGTSFYTLNYALNIWQWFHLEPTLSDKNASDSQAFSIDRIASYPGPGNSNKSVLVGSLIVG